MKVDDASVVEALVMLAHSRSLQVVAEGGWNVCNNYMRCNDPIVINNKASYSASPSRLTNSRVNISFSEPQAACVRRSRSALP